MYQKYNYIISKEGFSISQEADFSVIKIKEVRDILKNIDEIILHDNLFEEAIFNLQDYTEEISKEYNIQLLYALYIFYQFLVFLIITKRESVVVHIPSSISNPLFLISKKIGKLPYLNDYITQEHTIFFKLMKNEFLGYKMKANILYTSLLKNVLKLFTNYYGELYGENLTLFREINKLKQKNKYYIKKFIIYENNDVYSLNLRFFEISDIIDIENAIVGLNVSNNSIYSELIDDLQNVPKIDTYYKILLLNEIYQFYSIEFKNTLIHYDNYSIKDKKTIYFYIEKLSEILDNLSSSILEYKTPENIGHIIDCMDKRYKTIVNQKYDMTLKNLLVWQNIVK